MREAIEMYFKQYPHMMKGYILDAINSPNLAAEVLKRRDAEVTAAERERLARIFDKQDTTFYGSAIAQALRLQSAEIEGEIK